MEINWLLLLGLVVWVPLVSVVHEAGHAAFAGFGGYRVTSFGVGRGRPLVRVLLPRGVVFHIGRWFLAGGTCVAIPRHPTAGPMAAWFHGGGIVFQCVLAVFLWLIPEGAWTPWVLTGAKLNGWVVVWNLFPWRVGTFASDGWWLISRLFRRAAVQRPLFTLRGSLERIQTFEDRVQSPVGSWYAGLMLAWADSLLGLPKRGLASMNGRLPDQWSDPHLRALACLVHADALRRSGAPMAAIQRLAESGAEEVTDETADLLRVVEGAAWLDLGEGDRVRRILGLLAGTTGIVAGEVATLALDLAVREGDAESMGVLGLRLCRLSAGGLLDPIRAADVLMRASSQVEGAELQARLRGRAVGLVRGAASGASRADRQLLAQMLVGFGAGGGT